MELTDFLLARVAEDEAAAREAIGKRVDISAIWSDAAVSRHINRWSSARVLAECESKRRILAEHEISRDLSDYERSCGRGKSFGCLTCHEWDGIICGNGYCGTLRALALPYGDHPDFDEAWRL